MSNAVYSRNKQVEEDLGIRFAYVSVNSNAHSPNVLASAVRQNAQNTEKDAFHIVSQPSYYSVSLILDGLYQDLATVENSYLDLSRKYWSAGFINASTVNYTISWLTHAGVLLFIGTFIGGLIQGAKVKDLFIVLWNTVKQLKKTFITVICLVGLSTIMDSSGMIAVIATALATATGSLYPLFAPVIGCLGTFITGSDTSSNILFGKLQASVAGQIHVSPDWLSAANTVGATGGKIISPQSIAIATSAGNQQGKEGEILKAAIPYALVYVAITGIIVYIFS